MRIKIHHVFVFPLCMFFFQACAAKMVATEVKAPPKSVVKESLEVEMPALEGVLDSRLKSDTALSKKKTRRAAKPTSSGLKAGYSDDNQQFNFFLNFLDTYRDRVNHYPLNISERIVFTVQDKQGRSIPNAAIEIHAGQTPLCQGKTTAAGSFLFFPAQYDTATRGYTASISYNGSHTEVAVERNGPRQIEVILDHPKNIQQEILLDIVFILDTTGSMGEEIQRLKSTIEIINMNLAALAGTVVPRFGMVLYRDKDEAYVTHTVELTKNLAQFQRALSNVSAAGGGDTPEDLQSALKESLKRINWNENGIRLGFIITDAPPHLDYEQQYTYADAAIDAKTNGIKLFSVGTGGLDVTGEYILRQISQYTSAKYIFLTYGERGESEGGRPGSVSHHTGANFQTDKLEAIIIRMAKEELADFTDQPLKTDEDYFEAVRMDDEKREETLEKLFTMAVSQLIDYAAYRIQERTPASVLPISAGETRLKPSAEYFTEQLSLSFSQHPAFKMVERVDLQKVVEELKLTMAGLTENQNSTKVGKMMGADLILAGNLYRRADTYELFLKLLRVATGEVLSVTKLKIDFELGLEK